MYNTTTYVDMRLGSVNSKGTCHSLNFFTYLVAWFLTLCYLDRARIFLGSISPLLSWQSWGDATDAPIKLESSDVIRACK